MEQFFIVIDGVGKIPDHVENLSSGEAQIKAIAMRENKTVTLRYENKDGEISNAAIATRHTFWTILPK